MSGHSTKFDFKPPYTTRVWGGLDGIERGIRVLEDRMSEGEVLHPGEPGSWEATIRFESEGVSVMFWGDGRIEIHLREISPSRPSW